MTSEISIGTHLLGAGKWRALFGIFVLFAIAKADGEGGRLEAAWADGVDAAKRLEEPFCCVFARRC